MTRDYKKEYLNFGKKYEASAEQKHNRAMRNKARREALRDGRVSKGDGKDIDHKMPLKRGGSTSKSNTRVTSQKANRGWRKGKSGYNP